MKNNIKGFTLTEILVALVIGSMMLIAVYNAVITAQRSSTGIEGRVLAQQDARSSLEIMAMEIAMASYNPTLTSTNIWVDAANCSLAGAILSKGIQEAAANSITVQMDLNGNGTIMDVANEVIAYNYDPVNQYITRETNCAGGAQPFLGATNANIDRKNVLVVNNTAGPGGAAIPVFRYYDGSGAELVPPIALIADIRRIEITLVVDSQHVNPTTGVRSRVIYSTSIIPRNHISNYTY